MKEIVINGKAYKSAEITFNALCAFEDLGLSLDSPKQLSLVRAWIALTAGITLEEAGKLIEEHLANGGDFEPILEAFSEEVDASGFFRSLFKGTEATPTESQSEEA